MIKIGGLQKLTMVDYPGKIAATVFLTGCNFKCGFCHNFDIVDPDIVSGRVPLPESEFFDFLDSKIGLIDGICITGGEPTINSDLMDFIKKIKDKGFLIKLDTNGSNPEMLEKLLKDKLLDFVAMDVKTSPEKYEETIIGKIHPVKSRVAGSRHGGIFNRVKKSVDIIKNSGIDYEFRTTVVPGIIEKGDIEKIGQWLQGSKKFALQQFRNHKVLDKTFEKIQPYPDETLKEFKNILEKYIKKVELRT